ncbi:hypothetical protein HDU77_007792 [Chytriomyces hyalinus]|nr:hypothetical protein HDU77_007792 [Chytriomyces hyalinus]
MDTNAYERAGPAFIGRPVSEDAGKAVILCGWMDGHLKHVEKYAHFYRTNGYTAYILLSAYPVSAPYAVSELNAKGNLTGPRLFLYSDVDELCAMDEVQRRIEACKAEGIVTEEKLFIGSLHVKHAVVHKDEYWSLVSQFLSRHE